MKLHDLQVVNRPSSASQNTYSRALSFGKNFTFRNLFLGLGILFVLGAVNHMIRDSATSPTGSKSAAVGTANPAPSASGTTVLQAPNKRSAREEAMLDETARVSMAKVMENSLLSEGLNVDVNASGLHHTTLKVRWIGVSKVTAYQFAHEGASTLTSLQNAGFRKFIITDGYDESWTWNFAK